MIKGPFGNYSCFNNKTTVSTMKYIFTTWRNSLFYLLKQLTQSENRLQKQNVFYFHVQIPDNQENTLWYRIERSEPDSAILTLNPHEFLGNNCDGWIQNCVWQILLACKPLNLVSPLSFPLGKKKISQNPWHLEYCKDTDNHSGMAVELSQVLKC